MDFLSTLSKALIKVVADGKQILYHGGGSGFNIRQPFTYYTPDREYAEKYARQHSNPRITTVYLKNNAKIYPTRYWWKDFKAIWKPKEHFKGFDAVMVQEPNFESDSYVVINPDALEFIKTENIAESSLRDWSGSWVHYTDLEKLGMNPKQSHQDIMAIYFFPENFKLEGSVWGKMKYKYTVMLKPNAKVLDLSELSLSDMLDICAKLNLPKAYVDEVKNADSFWEVLKGYYILSSNKSVSAGAAKWNKAFRDLGYDAVFDDTGSIHAAEAQIAVLDPKMVKVLKVEPLNIKRGQYDRIKKHQKMLAKILRPYGEVEIKDPVKKKILYERDKYETCGLVELKTKDMGNFTWKITEDELNLGRYMRFEVSDTMGRLPGRILNANDEKDIEKYVSEILSSKER